MNLNFPRFLVFPKAATRWLVTLVLFSLQGRFSPMALDYAVIEYDKTTTDILSKLILLNIARSHQHQPMHLAMTRNTILLNIR